MFLKHDLNLFNFVIRLNQALRDAGLELRKAAHVDFSMIREPGAAARRHAATAGSTSSTCKARSSFSRRSTS